MPRDHQNAEASLSSASAEGHATSWPGSSVSTETQPVPVTVIPIGGESRVNTFTNSNQRSPSVTALSDGGWVVTWQSENQDDTNPWSVWGVYQQRYDHNGAKVGAEIRVNTYDSTGGVTPSVTALVDGGWLVTWQSEGRFSNGDDIYQKRFDRFGEEVGADTLVNSGFGHPQSRPSVTALVDGGWLVTWQSFTQDGSFQGVYQQRYSSDGLVAGEETRVNTTTESSQYHPAVTGLSDGGWLVTWQSTFQHGNAFGIYQQRYSSTGSAVGGETLVSTDTAGEAAVVALAGGGWVVTWSSWNQDGPGYGVYQQRYSSHGATVGAEVQVNSFTTGDQRGPSITALSDGGWLVTWDSYNQDGDGSGVYQQRYDSAGNVVGGETRVNTVTANGQWSSSVTGLADGGWLVAWESDAQDGSGWGIYAQRYQGVENATSDDFAGTVATTGAVTMDGVTAGAIETVGDSDWFRVALSAGATYQFDLEGSETGHGSLADPFLRLRDESGRSLAFNDDGTDGLNSRITFTAGHDGVYYLSVGSATTSGTGTYRLSASQNSPTGVDDYADNISTLGTASVNGIGTGSIETAGDTDWFRVRLEAGHTYQLDMFGSSTGVNTLVDSYMRIRDSEGRSIDYNDDGGAGHDAQIRSFTASYTGDFYISAGSSTVGGTGTYQIGVTQTGTPATPVDPETPVTSAMPILLIPFSNIGTGNVEARILQPFGQHGYVAGGKDGTGYWSMDIQGALFTEAVLAGSSGTVYAIQFGQPETVLIDVPVGDPLYGVYDRKTNDASPGRLGNFVTIKTNEGLYVTYAHLTDDATLRSLSVGSNVVAGQTELGHLGRTGLQYTNTGNPWHVHMIVGSIPYPINGTEAEIADGRNGSNLDEFFILSTFSGHRVDGFSGEPSHLIGVGGGWEYAQLGTDVRDIVSGYNGNAAIYTFGGDDEILISGGGNFVDGGLGFDSVSFLQSRQAIYLDLSNQSLNAGGALGDELVGAERIVGTHFGDVVRAGADHLIVDGAGGDDVLGAGAGNDILNGGDGTDTADYADASAGVTVNLAITTRGQNTGGSGRDTLTGVENLTGSAFGDDFSGDEGANVLRDVLGGDDRFIGGAGNDTLILERSGGGAATTSLLRGGLGDDAMSFDGHGRYTDTVAFEGQDGNDVISATGAFKANINAGGGNDRVTVDTLGGSFVVKLGSGSDTLVLAGTGGAFAGSAANLVRDFAAGNGGDVLDLTQYLAGGALTNFTAGSNPFLSGHMRLVQAGADTLVQVDPNGGGDGFVTVLTLQKTLTSSFTAFNFNGLAPLPAALEGTAGPDALTGTSAIDVLNGNGGDDVLVGRGNHDVLNGGAGADVLDGGAGDDVLNGGSGAQGDTATYATASAGVRVNLALSGQQDTVGYGVDSLIGIEHLIGSSFTDELRGDGFANRLTDTRGGDDFLRGEAGDDTLLIARSGGGAATTVRLNGGDGTDALTFTGNGRYSDTVTLEGEAGNDVITVSGAGTVGVDAGAGNDTVVYDTLGGAYRITLGEGSDTVRLASTGGQFAASGDNLVRDFATGPGGDIVDLSAWLAGGALTNYSGGNPFADGHMRLVQNGSRTLLQVDRDGGGDGYQTVLAFTNTTAAAFTAANFGGFDPAGLAPMPVEAADKALDAGPQVLPGLADDDFLVLPGEAKDALDQPLVLPGAEIEDLPVIAGQDGWFGVGDVDLIVARLDDDYRLNAGPSARDDSHVPESWMF